MGILGAPLGVAEAARGGKQQRSRSETTRVTARDRSMPASSGYELRWRPRRARSDRARSGRAERPTLSPKHTDALDWEPHDKQDDRIRYSPASPSSGDEVPVAFSGNPEELHFRLVSQEEPTDETVELDDEEGTEEIDAESPPVTKFEINCEEELRDLKSLQITDIRLDIGLDGTPGDGLPIECTMGDELFVERAWGEVTYQWTASSLCHKPLYFENVHLERYGHTCGPYLQPLASGAHFFGALPILPYKMGLETPHECIYTLGHYRPGNCAPYLIDPIPISKRAALFQAGASLGTVFILP